MYFVQAEEEVMDIRVPVAQAALAAAVPVVIMIVLT
jgi:hypothetical protein